MKTFFFGLFLLIVLQAVHQTDSNDLMRLYYSIHKGPELSVDSTSFNHDGAYLLYGSKVNDTFHHLNVYYWDIRTHVKLPGMFHKDHISTIEYGKNSKRIYTASEDGTVKIWSNTNGFPLLKTLHAPGEVYKAIINPEETRLVTVGSVAHGKAKIAIFNLRNYERIDEGDLFHTDSIFAADFNKIDTDIFATGSNDGTVGFWNARTLKKEKQYLVSDFWTDKYDDSKKTLGIRSVAFNPKSEELVYSVKTVELDGHNNFGIIYQNGTIRYQGHIDGLITDMDWSPEGSRLIASTTFGIANYLVIIDPFQDILYFSFYSNNFITNLDVNHDGSMISLNSPNKFTLLRVRYECEDIKYTTSDKELFECPCRRSYEWSATRIGCF